MDDAANNPIDEPILPLDGSAGTPRPASVTVIAILCFAFAAMGVFGTVSGLVIWFGDFRPGDTAPGRDLIGSGGLTGFYGALAFVIGVLSIGLLIFAALRLLAMRRSGWLAAHAFAALALVMTAANAITGTLVVGPPGGYGATESIAVQIGSFPGAGLGAPVPVAFAIGIFVVLDRRRVRKLFKKA